MDDDHSPNDNLAIMVHNEGYDNEPIIEPQLVFITMMSLSINGTLMSLPTRFAMPWVCKFKAQMVALVNKS